MIFSSINLKKYERVCKRRLHVVPKPGVVYKDESGNRRYFPISVAGYTDCPKCQEGLPLDKRLIQNSA